MIFTRSGSRGPWTYFGEPHIYLLATEYHEASPEENDLLTGKKNLLYRYERRKKAISAVVIWYVVLFRQKYTDRPNRISARPYAQRTFERSTTKGFTNSVF
jgi:hypothetical protein